MRTILQENRGISVIIGALMLTLIVVTAATSFAVFINQKQKEIEKAQQYEYMRSLEKLSINSLKDIDDSNNTLNISISSIHSRDTSFNIYINSIVGRFDYGNTSNFTAYLKGYENKFFKVNSTANISNNNPLTIKIVTEGYTNTFERTFYPPIGLINVETYTELINGSFHTYYVIDGTSSYAIGDGIYLVSWTWNINNNKSYGQKIRIANIDTKISLTVRDNMGMVGIADAVYN